MKNKTMIVAELSANHGHRLDIALESVRAAARAGADAIKIQTYTADTITLDCNAPDFIVTGGTLWDGRTLHNLYEEAFTPWEWHEAIFAEASKAGIICFSTPFDRTAVDFLESLGNPIYKIASFEITDTPLISYAATKGKPMVLSTGIATLEDIERAVAACRQAGNDDITLLKCTSAYPAPISAANLRTMEDMAQRFGVKVGLSDHTTGAEVALTAAALGASMIEKHFIIDRSLGGPDVAFSMEIGDLTAMVSSIRTINTLPLCPQQSAEGNGQKCVPLSKEPRANQPAEQKTERDSVKDYICEEALGSVTYPADPASIPGRQFCRSLYVAEDMKSGDIITEQNVRSVRPGYGLAPRYLPEILGKPVTQNLTKGTRFSLDFITLT